MRLMTTLAAAVVAMSVGAVSAQDWPSKPVKVIVPFPPAGATDIAARVIADSLSKQLNQTFVVENKPGAAGTIGMEQAVRAAPDGYTLAVIPDTVSSAPAVYKLSYDPIKGLAPIVQLSRQPIVIAAHPSLGVKSAADLIAAAKKKPGMGYATSGIGTQQHMVGEWFAKLTGIDIKHIPYKGGGQAINDFVAGQVPLAVLGSSPLLPHHKSGKVQLIAQTTAERAPTLKDVPTTTEAGYKQLLIDQWLGLFAPAGTDAAIIAKLNKVVNVALKDAEVIARFEKGALEPVGGDSETFARLVKSDNEKYVRLSKELGIKIE